jgi:hypothetical protein
VSDYDQAEYNERVDCINGRCAKGSGYTPDGPSGYPQCYFTSDGLDAMEGSISGGGCRPSNNAMWYGNTVAISTIARQLAQKYQYPTAPNRDSLPTPTPTPTATTIATSTDFAALAANFSLRAAKIRQMYLSTLWDDEIQFFSVRKDGSPKAPHGTNNQCVNNVTGVDGANGVKEAKAADSLASSRKMGTYSAGVDSGVKVTAAARVAPPVPKPPGDPASLHPIRPGGCNPADWWTCNKTVRTPTLPPYTV